MKNNEINELMKIISNIRYNLSNDKLLFIYDVLTYYLKDKKLLKYELQDKLFQLEYENTKVTLVFYRSFFYINFSDEQLDINYDCESRELLLKKYNYENNDDEIPYDAFYCYIDDYIIIDYYRKNVCNLFEISTECDVQNVSDFDICYDSRLSFKISDSYDMIIKSINMLGNIEKKHPVFYTDEKENVLYIK